MKKRGLKLSVVLMSLSILVGCNNVQGYYTNGHEMIYLNNAETAYTEEQKAFYEDLWVVSLSGLESETLDLWNRANFNTYSEYENMLKERMIVYDDNKITLHFLREQLTEEMIEAIGQLEPGIEEAIREVIDTPVENTIQVTGGRYGEFLVGISTVDSIELAGKEGEKGLIISNDFITLQKQLNDFIQPNYIALQEKLEGEEFLVTRVWYAGEKDGGEQAIVLENAFFDVMTMSMMTTEIKDGQQAILYRENGDYIEKREPVTIVRDFPSGVSYIVYLNQNQEVQKVRMSIIRQEGKTLTQELFGPMTASLALMGVQDEEVQALVEELIQISTTKTVTKKGEIEDFAYLYNKVKGEGIEEYIEIVVE